VKQREENQVAAMFDLDNLVRENIKRLVPYSSARKEFAGSAQIFLDANENSFGSPIAADYSRYPDPLQREIKEKVAEGYGIGPDRIFVGNGSDEAIDLVIRIFCEPGQDEVMVLPPTYGMYEVSAAINDIGIKRVNLTADFKLDLDAVQAAIDGKTKVIFFCSPNNPTGNRMCRETMIEVAQNFNGIVVVDEAYIHFSGERSLVSENRDLPNLLILQTFSKGWGLAGLRVGLAFGSHEIIELFNRIKPPYNISQVAQELILTALSEKREVTSTVAKIVSERQLLADSLVLFDFVKIVYPSDANFLLVRMTNANSVYDFLLRDRIVVRNRNNLALCVGCLRITIGTPEENLALLESLKRYEKGSIH
jgi:histidinol-phosphate aminotransferase